MQNKIRKRIPIAIFVLALCVLLSGLITTIFFPRDDIVYENRYANKLGALSISSYLDGSFQSAMENALGDQVNMAIKSKKLYNILDTAAALPVKDWLQERGEGYINFRRIMFYEDFILHSAVSPAADKSNFNATADELNLWINSCPQQSFYLYYIESDSDINMETGEKSGVFEYFSSMLELPAENMGRLEINSFEEYKTAFMKTDHHWSSAGSYRGLCEVCTLLGVEPVKAVGTHTVYDMYSGTKAAGIEGFPKEEFSVTQYEFAPMDIFVNGEPVNDYGSQSEFISGELKGISYGSVYGGDEGEVCFDTGSDGENLLVLGDSCDNAIIKALSCSFAKTYAVDLRAYPYDKDTGFQLDEYVKAHHIDKVLFIGCLAHFAA